MNQNTRFMNSLEYLGAIGVGKGWMVSYHHMCRWNSGMFYKHPRLDTFDWYWRVEPDVKFLCDIDYDPFQFMVRHNKTYGSFNINILDDARSFPSLWKTTKEFMSLRPELLHPDRNLDWLLDEDGEYNSCQYFSNFEIANLNFFRGDKYNAYFDYLDKKGGFFYERLGDAPVHTLALSLLLPKDAVHFFRDIGYVHDVNSHCPPFMEQKCQCEPTSLDSGTDMLVPPESPQKRPIESCIRRWLGAKWIKNQSDESDEDDI
ncbi:Alpha-1,2 mannosyltransferase KTR1 [Neolecta irregularis DAH-3]|uniref:Alpha-1,2 mannosyltransferase KTR1 n=1 Tax=Neolecta irregularis (strain DAH-3) TaxID=1198029 RepID=A0A1U7LTC6_NEOID|nr:Alpha-1,2 mannosyltransferase KTR1 [Neolecta irregularis DAH-3]|eukprot:OLL25879.1 Alpha-1,2 mannosyltransferase KTR1 [Neolecta irregularis DAH-3]